MKRLSSFRLRISRNATKVLFIEALHVIIDQSKENCKKIMNCELVKMKASEWRVSIKIMSCSSLFPHYVPLRYETLCHHCAAELCCSPAATRGALFSCLRGYSERSSRDDFWVSKKKKLFLHQLVVSYSHENWGRSPARQSWLRASFMTPSSHRNHSLFSYVLRLLLLWQFRYV